MHGFGYWKDFRNLMEQADDVGGLGLVKNIDPSEGMTEDVIVPKLEKGSDPFKKQVIGKKAGGSAGNSLKAQSDDAQFGCVDAQVEFGGLGIGGEFKKGGPRSMSESFHAGDVVDDASMDKARDVAAGNQPEKIVSEHEVFKKLDDMWKDIWGETYKDKVKKVQNNNYDHDFTKLQPKYSVEISAGTPRTQISNPSMKRGW